ncbi:MAG: enoyl-CoA hydratase [Gammaproteobacteria bacterium]|nr:enoyl-CoA hydratase [Gammaproteobacteria bacterium]
MSNLVTYSSDDSIATITINRADRLNALNEEVIVGLAQAWTQFEDSQDRVAVLHAAGDRAFSVGADVKSPPAEMWQGVPSVGVATSKPVIAAVHGWCIGGAYCIVQMCDLVVASETTIFKYPEAQLGFTGGLIASAVARIPHKFAMEFMMLGEEFDASRAQACGMVNKVVPKGTELEAAMVWAKILTNSAPLVLQTTKKFSLQTLNKSPAEAGAVSREQLLKVRNSEDGAEGGRAFAQKRTPVFKGR